MILLTNFYDFRFKWTPTAAIGIHPTKSWLSQLVNFKNSIKNLEERYAIKCHAMKAGSTAMTQRPRDRVLSGSLLALPDPRRTDRAIPHTNFWWSLFFFDSTGMIYMHWVPTGQTVNKKYYAEVFREFSKRFLGKRTALFKSGQWYFHQHNAPVHNSVLVTDYLTKMGIKIVPYPPYSPDLAPCDFWLFPNLRDSWGGETVYDEGHWHAHTGLPRGVPEVVGTVPQVHCSWMRLLRRGIEFPVFTINKSSHTKNVWKLI